jgi:hypothetical protein
MGESDGEQHDEPARACKNSGMKSEKGGKQEYLRRNRQENDMRLPSEKRACPRKGTSLGPGGAARPLSTRAREQRVLERQRA